MFILDKRFSRFWNAAWTLSNCWFVNLVNWCFSLPRTLFFFGRARNELIIVKLRIDAKAGMWWATPEGHSKNISNSKMWTCHVMWKLRNFLFWIFTSEPSTKQHQCSKSEFVPHNFSFTTPIIASQNTLCQTSTLCILVMQGPKGGLIW